jgi:hypothetical protein
MMNPAILHNTENWDVTPILELFKQAELAKRRVLQECLFCMTVLGAKKATGWSPKGEKTVSQCVIYLKNTLSIQYRDH